MGVELLKVPVELAPSGNPLNFKVRAGNYTVEGHRLTAQIFIETVPDSGAFTALPIMHLDPDETGIADLDVSTILNRRMYTDLPVFENTSTVRLLHSTLRYKLLFKEEYSNSVATKETSIFTAIKCRLNYYNYPLETLKEYVIQGKNYLSHHPDVIETIPGSIHYLVCLALEPTMYTIKLIATYSDGSQVSKTLSTFTTTTKYNVFAIPAGLRHLNLAVTGKQLLDYTIWIEDTDGIAFRKIKYLVSRSRLQNRCFLFFNILGGIDTIITGSQSDSIKVERETFLSYLNPDFKASDRNILTSVSNYSNNFETTTGYISRKMVELCKEFAISESAYLVGKRSFIAINIEKATFDIANDNDDLYSFKFKYSPAFSRDIFLLSKGAEESYSNDYNEDYE